MTLILVVFFMGFFLNHANLEDLSNSTSDSLRDRELNSRIYGGRHVVPHSYPFEAHVLIYYSTWLGACGGSLIDKRWVITAAHCIAGAEKVRVILGAHNLSNRMETGRTSYYQKEIFIHEDYVDKRGKLFNDIGLIELKKDVELNENVNIIAIARGNDDYAGCVGTILGWGDREDEEGPNILREADVVVITNNFCKATGGHPNIQETNICSSFDCLRGTCKGDSGGPLVLRNRGKPDVLIGLNSYGRPICSQKRVSVFTRVSSFSKWIDKTMDVQLATDTRISRSFIVSANNWLLIMILFFKYKLPFHSNYNI